MEPDVQHIQFCEKGTICHTVFLRQCEGQKLAGHALLFYKHSL